MSANSFQNKESSVHSPPVRENVVSQGLVEAFYKFEEFYFSVLICTLGTIMVPDFILLNLYLQPPKH